MAGTGRLWLGVMAALSLWSACASPPQKKGTVEVLVSAAASLKDVMGDIAPAFERTNPGTRLTFNFGASGQLRIQIENGAPADVFISAGAADMDALEQKGLIDDSTRRDVARNTLVLIRNRAAAPGFRSMEGLANESVARIAIGNPATVPAGLYAKEALESAGLYDRLKARLVLGENVRQVLDYLARGEADAGFVYRTDAMTESRVEVVEAIPASRHQAIRYPAAALKTGDHAASAKAFVEYLRSQEARRIFGKYGFE